MNKANSLYLIIGCLILILIVIFYLNGVKNNTRIEFLTYPKHYSIILTEEDQTFLIPFYISKHNTMYSIKETIDAVYLVSQDTEDFIQLQIDQLENQNEQITLNKDNFYKYRLKLSTNIISDRDLQILHFPNAMIKIQYHNGEIINLFIGELSITKVKSLGVLNQNYLDIKISNIKGLINKVNDENTVVGIEMTIQKISNQSIKITNIGLISSKIKANYDFIIFNQSFPTFTTEKNDVFGSLYHLTTKGTQDELSYLFADHSVKMLLPLYYDDLSISINNIGIYIEYELEDTKKTYVFGTFCFFDSNVINQNGVRYLYERN